MAQISVLSGAKPEPAPPRPSLTTNFSWSFLGNTVYAASQWGMLALLSKSRSPADVGTFVYGFALATPAYVLAQLQLRPIQATDVHGRYSFSTYLTLRTGCVALTSFIMLAALVISRPNPETFWTCAFICVARAAESMSDVLYGAMQLHEDMRTQSMSLCVKAVLSLAFMAFGLRISDSVAGAAAGVAAAWLVVFAAYDVPATVGLLRYPIRFERSYRSILALAKEALPLGIVMLLLSLNVNIPRYFLKAGPGASSLGIYAALTYVMVAGTTVVSALGQSAAPKLARHYQFGDIGTFRRLLSKLLLVGLALGLSGIAAATLFGRPILTILYKPQYASYLQPFVLVAVASCLAYIASFFGYGMTAALQYKPQLVAIGLTTITLTSACLLLVPSRGVAGAAIATLLSNAVLAVSCGLLLWSAVAGRPV